jgi:dihydropyrimidinase
MIMHDLLIKNATIVNHDKEFISDVLVDHNVITKIAPHIDEIAKETIDGTDKYLLPGAIDSHTHMEMPFGGTTSNDTYASGSKRGLEGGVTSFIDYAIQRKGQSIIESVNKRRELAKKENSPGSVYFHCAITDLEDDKLLEEFPLLKKHHINSIKCYMVYRNEGMMMSLSNIAKILPVADANHIMVNVHAEDVDMLEANILRFKKEGKLTPYYHYLSRDEEVEYKADKELIQLSKELSCPLYIVHLADKKGVELVRQAKKEHVKIYAETCPQYLCFTSEVYKRKNAIDFVCSPSIKGQESQDELWRAIVDGTIDTVATDHCPFKESEKLWGKDDFTKIPNGCGGIAYLYRYMLSEAIKRDIPFTRIVSLLSYNPSIIFNIEHKGLIQEGYDADLILFDKHKTYTIKHRDDDDSNIYEGMTLIGDLKTISYKKRY